MKASGFGVILLCLAMACFFIAHSIQSFEFCISGGMLTLGGLSPILIEMHERLKVLEKRRRR